MTPAARPTPPDGAELHSARWVVQQLGMSPRTLRDRHRRYGLEPSLRTEGGHHRYTDADLRRLESLCRLVADGVPVGEAARLSHPESSVRPGAPARAAAAADQRVELLSRAALALDQRAATEIIVGAVRTSGVVSAWTDVLAPALRLRGERFGRTADGVNVEHLLSECTRAVLSALTWQPRRWLRTRPVLLAAPDGEQHVLPLYALAAALAEHDLPSVLLGASVPEQALVDSATRLEPAAVFLWSQAPDTAARPAAASMRPALVVGGPGWPEHTSGRVDTLAEALRTCAARVPAARPAPAPG